MPVISGIGTALPQHSLPTEDFIKHAKQFACKNERQERILEELYRRTTICSRSSVLAGSGYGASGERVFAPPESIHDRGPSTSERMQYYVAEIGTLASVASRGALEHAGINAAQITHLVTVSCTGFHAPGFDIGLVHDLPLSSDVARTHVGFMGCHGGMNGLKVANAFVKADAAAKVLLCMAEACSLHFQYGWGTNKLVANSLFSDGAAACVISASPANSLSSWRIVDAASYIVPDSTEAMGWRIGDHGFEMHLSTAVPDLVEQYLPRWLDNWLNRHKYRRSDITAWAVHPGGPKILDAVESSLQLDARSLDPSREILEKCGNMSSPTAFFILDQLSRQPGRKPVRPARRTSGELAVMLGFGPGLTLEAALFEQVDPE